jgi:hypothetical protein
MYHTRLCLTTYLQVLDLGLGFRQSCLKSIFLLLEFDYLGLEAKYQHELLTSKNGLLQGLSPPIHEHRL